ARGVEGDADFVRLAACTGGDVQLAMVSLGDAPVDEQRLPQKQILWALRIDVGDFDAFERELHVCEHGTFDGFEQAAHALSNFVEVGDVRECAAAELRHFRGKEEIRSTADGYRVQTGSAQILPHRGEDLL